MGDGKKQAAPDLYDWVVSQEIRNYLRENHRFSFREKIQLICGACRPLEEKYDALRTLWEESVGEEKVLAGELVRLHDWAFDQLYRETPGQVFVFMEEQGCDTGRYNTRYVGVDRMFRTYEELTAHIQEREGWYQEPPPYWTRGAGTPSARRRSSRNGPRWAEKWRRSSRSACSTQRVAVYPAFLPLVADPRPRRGG